MTNIKGMDKMNVDIFGTAREEGMEKQQLWRAKEMTSGNRKVIIISLILKLSG